MPEEDWGIHHPLNELAAAGKAAYEDRPTELQSALNAGSLEEACEALGHPGGVAMELMKLLSHREKSMIKRRVLESLDSGALFPFICSLKDEELARLPRVFAHEVERRGRTVVLITKDETPPEGEG